MVPTEAQTNQARSESGPVSTRFTGDLSLDKRSAPMPAAEPTSRIPGPDRIEVTQPYIPAIRDEQPEFAKRVTPEPTPPAAPAALATASPPTAPTQPVPAPVPASAPPGAPQQPAAPPVSPASPAAPAAPPKRRSLARRVVRRIIGPDLLRKDPPKKRK